MLPYIEDWTFTAGEPELLRGNSGFLNVTLGVEEVGESPEQHLRALQAALGSSGGAKGVEQSELVTFRKEPVLRIVVDAAAASGREEFKGAKMIHLHAAKRWGKAVYVLHLSRVIPPAEASSFDEKPLLNCATAGFRVDFMRGEE